MRFRGIMKASGLTQKLVNGHFEIYYNMRKDFVWTEQYRNGDTQNMYDSEDVVHVKTGNEHLTMSQIKEYIIEAIAPIETEKAYQEHIDDMAK